MKPKLKPPGTRLLKLECDMMLSTSAFKFNVRRYTLVREAVGQPGLGRVLVVDGGRDLHSSTFRLNVSAF